MSGTAAGPGLEAVEVDISRDGPSYAKEAEQAVASICIQGTEAALDAVAEADPDLFLHEGRRRIVEAAHRIAGRDQVPDLPMVLQNLRHNGDLEEIGGTGFVADVYAFASTDAQLSAYLDELREARARRCIAEAVRDAELEVSEHDSAAAALVEIQGRLRDVQQELPEPNRSGIRTVSEILEDPETGEAPATVADKVAWAGRVTLLAGREKSGKSTLARWVVARLSCGERVWGGPPIGGSFTVLYHGQEPDGDVARDLERFGADGACIHYRDMRRTAGDRLAVLRRDLEDVAPDVVVVDTLSTLVQEMGLEEGSSTDWEPIMGRLGALAVDSGAAVVVLHHARKADNTYRGSTSIGAGADCILEMQRAPAEGENVRKVWAKPRAAIPVRDFTYVRRGGEEAPRLELSGGELSLDAQILRFVDANPGCSTREVREAKGVRAKAMEVTKKLREMEGEVLLEDGDGARHAWYVQDSGSSQDPQGTGTEP